MKHTLRFPILIEASIIVENNFWSQILKDLAHGKAPHGCYVSQSNFLVNNSKNAAFSYFLDDPKKDAKTMSDEIIQILNEKTNIMSTTDRTKKKLVFNNVKQKLIFNIKNASWGHLRKKKMKDQLLDMYALSIKNHKNWDITKTREFLTELSLDIIFKKIESENIVMENGKIVTIYNSKS
jgi:hypothetical protein